MAWLGKFVFGTFVGLWSAYVLYSLWGWFVVPLGAPAITFAHAFGLGLFLSMIGIYTVVEMPSGERGTELMIVKALFFGIIWLTGAGLNEWAMP